MQTYVFTGVLTALSSVAHGGEKRGITSLLNREKVVQPDGTIEDVVMLTGNGIRGSLRDVSMLHLLAALGYGTQEGDLKLDLETFYFFMSGGVLDSGGKRGLDIDLARKWRELIPPISLLGSAVGNQTLPGKLDVGKGIPICKETAHILPEQYRALVQNSIWDLTQREGYTRMDDAKSDNVRGLLAVEYRKQLEDGSKKSREAAREGELVADEPGAKHQMRYYIETLATGTQFFWEVCLRDPSDLEFDCFAVMLTQWATRCTLGGCRGKGLGRFALHFDQWISLDPRMGLRGTEVDKPLGNRYAEHIQAHADEIRSFLSGIQG